MHTYIVAQLISVFRPRSSAIRRFNSNIEVHNELTGSAAEQQPTSRDDRLECQQRTHGLQHGAHQALDAEAPEAAATTTPAADQQHTYQCNRSQSENKPRTTTATAKGENSTHGEKDGSDPLLIEL